MPMTEIERLVANAQIRDAMYRYARGVDRVDRELLESAYWPDATDDHIAFKGRASELIPWLVDSLANFDQTFHCLGQMWIEFTGDTTARVETYLWNYLRIKSGPDSAEDIVQAGRYLDVFECRANEWRIADRRFITDWIRELGPSASWTEPTIGIVWPMGMRKPDDPSYRWEK